MGVMNVVPNGRNGNGAAGTALAAAQGTQEVSLGFGSLQGFELIQRAARLLSESSLVPKEYQGSVPNCVIALNMANRMKSDPLMVMQNLYIVHGRPGWSAQFLISTFNTSGRFSALRYEWVGEEGADDWGCRAWAIESETGERLTGATVTIGLAKKEGWYERNGSKWKTMPQQMLMYRSAAWFIRAYAPEIAMGMHTEDEIRDTIELDPDNYSVMKEATEQANREPIDITPRTESAGDNKQAESPTETKEGAKERPSADKPKPESKEQKPAEGAPGAQSTLGPDF